MLKREVSIVIVVCLVFVSVWALVNLVVNCPNLDIETSYIPKTSSSSLPQSSVPEFGSFPLLMYLLYGFVLFLMGLFIAATVYAIVKRKKRILKEILINLLAGVLLIAFFMGVISLMKHVQEKGNVMVEPKNLTGPAGTEGIKTAGEVSLQPVITISILILCLGISLFLFCVFKATIDRLSERKKERRRVAGVLSQAIQEIEGGEDFRAAILRCYKKLCELLSRYGLGEQKSFTPRELEVIAEEKFGIRHESLGPLTALFEEARYSSHEITLEKKQEALKCLVTVKKELAGEK